MATSVGIRELRQNLSVYLRRVRKGERFVVTDRNEPVARLEPLPDDEDPLERLIEEGVLSRPTGDLLDVEPLPPDPDDPYALTHALEEQREERLD